MDDADTLVRMYSNCEITKVDFYNAKHKIYIKMQTSYKMHNSPPHHPYRSPGCQ